MTPTSSSAWAFDVGEGDAPAENAALFGGPDGDGDDAALACLNPALNTFAVASGLLTIAFFIDDATLDASSCCVF